MSSAVSSTRGSAGGQLLPASSGDCSKRGSGSLVSSGDFPGDSTGDSSAARGSGLRAGVSSGDSSGWSGSLTTGASSGSSFGSSTGEVVVNLGGYAVPS